MGRVAAGVEPAVVLHETSVDRTIQNTHLWAVEPGTRRVHSFPLKKFNRWVTHPEWFEAMNNDPRMSYWPHTGPGFDRVHRGYATEQPDGSLAISSYHSEFAPMHVHNHFIGKGFHTYDHVLKTDDPSNRFLQKLRSQGD